MGRGMRAAAVLLIGIVSGAFHDFLFVNLNYQIDTSSGPPRVPSPIPVSKHACKAGTCPICSG